MAPTSLNDESVSLSPLDVNLGDEEIVDVPADAPGHVACDGRVAPFPASGSDAGRKVGLTGDDGRFPGLVGVLRCGGDGRGGRVILVRLVHAGTVGFGRRRQEHGTLVHSSAGEVDAVVLGGSGPMRVVIGLLARV